MEFLIAYHGTNKRAARSIFKSGFLKKTYFAFNKKEAMKYGRFIFSVIFKTDPGLWHGEPDGFQFWIRNKIGVDKIIDCQIVRKQIKAEVY